jgi:hypothetical protein
MRERRQPPPLKIPDRSTPLATAPAKVPSVEVRRDDPKPTWIDCLVKTQPLVHPLFRAAFVACQKDEGDQFEIGDQVAMFDTEDCRVAVLATRAGSFSRVSDECFSMDGPGCYIDEEGMFFARATFLVDSEGQRGVTSEAPVRKTPDGHPYVEFRLVADLVENAPRIEGFALPGKCILRLALLLMMLDGPHPGDLEDRAQLLLPLLQAAYPTERRRTLIRALIFDTEANIHYHDLDQGSLTLEHGLNLLNETLHHDFIDHCQRSDGMDVALPDLSKLLDWVASRTPKSEVHLHRAWERYRRSYQRLASRGSQ